ncbi:hypothetical protein VY88_22145 [Azospirillum thiophilum]|nr:hypothetical protein VY88_22145 [Azospirillum thiophilum]
MLGDGLWAGVATAMEPDAMSGHDGIIGGEKAQLHLIFWKNAELAAAPGDSPFPKVGWNGRNIVGDHQRGFVLIAQAMLIIVVENAVDDDPRELIEVEGRVRAIITAASLFVILSDICRPIFKPRRR